MNLDSSLGFFFYLAIVVDNSSTKMVSFFSEETLCTLQTNRLSTGQFSVSVSSNGIKLRNAMEQKQILWSVEYTVVTSQQ